MRYPVLTLEIFVVVVPWSFRVNHRRSFVFRSSRVWIEKYLSSGARVYPDQRVAVDASIASFDALCDGDGGGCREGNGWDRNEGCVPRVARLGSMGFRHRARAGTRREVGRMRASERGKK